MKKKILIFSLAYYPKHIGGAEVAIKEITDRLSPEEYEFHLVCNRFDSTLPKEEKVGNVTVHRIGLVTKSPDMGDLSKWPLHLNKLFYQFTSFGKAKKLHKIYRFDGIWAMMAHSTGVPAARFKQAYPSVQYVLNLQEGDPPEYIEKKMRVFGNWFKKAFTTADKIQVLSNFLARWARNMGYNKDIVLIPNGTDTTLFSRSLSEQSIKNTHDVVLVSTSRLVNKNALDDVIMALPLLPKNVRFVNYGFGPDKEKLHTLAETLKVSDRVELAPHPGVDKLPPYLHRADIFIRPSRSEGQGISFIEAMAAGLPVIATQEGGIADFLFDEKRNPNKGTTGWAVDANSPEQIKLAVEDIINRPEKVTEVVVRAKAMAIEKYDWNLIAKRMDNEVFKPLFK